MEQALPAENTKNEHHKKDILLSQDRDECYASEVMAGADLAAFLPLHVGGRLRALALSMAGFRIGARSRMWGMPRIVGPRNLYENLQIGEETAGSTSAVIWIWAVR